MAGPRRLVLNDRYELEPLPIGRGGMGEVWVGRDIKLEREIAVKLIRFPDGVHDEELVRRFVRESRITARLEHPGVPPVYDVGTHEGRPFMVMQRIHGITVADLVAEQGPLPIGWAAAIAAQTCSVLAAAHRESLVHRDLKPGNLMLCPDGTVRVLDFGLAVALASADSQITRTGQTLGTPAYMAPELVMAGITGPYTDLYGVGCTLFEMLTGRSPFRGATAYAVMRKQVDEPPAPVRTVRGEVPVQLEDLLLELMAKGPEERPTNAEHVYDRLMPFARDLGMLPGVLASPLVASPMRMYASVVGRVLPNQEPPVDTAPDSPAVRSVPTGFSRSELIRARSEAGSLARRFELANIRFDGGDYRSAAEEYRKLAADIAAHVGADDDRILQCRLQEATCNALTGATELALQQLGDLLDDVLREHGADDDRALELRRQIALLHLGMGRRREARAELRALLADAERVRGQNDPLTSGVRAALHEADRPPGSGSP
jgi:serine/threonine protein kinase